MPSSIWPADRYPRTDGELDRARVPPLLDGLPAAVHRLLSVAQTDKGSSAFDLYKQIGEHLARAQAALKAASAPPIWDTADPANCFYRPSDGERAGKVKEAVEALAAAHAATKRLHPALEPALHVVRVVESLTEGGLRR